MNKNNDIVNVNIEQFAKEVLFYWLCKQMEDKEIEDNANIFKIDLSKNRDNFVSELCYLNMWVIKHVCDSKIEEIDIKKNVLIYFHNFAFRMFSDDVDKDAYNKWLDFLLPKYKEYTEALTNPKTEKDNKLWELAKVFNKNIFGEIKINITIQLPMLNYISLQLIHLSDAIVQYKIEIPTNQSS